MSAFDACLKIVVGSEGGFSDDAADPGNWTGGRCGAGECRGTKYGISAAAYPDVNIGALTLAAASDIYRHDYWDRVCGDQLPGPLALLVFDAAVNAGRGRAAKWLQRAAGVAADGVVGPKTLAAVSAYPGGVDALCAEFMALRMDFLARLPTWRTFGLGWARRLARLPYQSVAIATVLALLLVGGWAAGQPTRPAMEMVDQPNCTSPDVEVPEGFTFCLDNFRKRLMEV